MSDFLTVAHRVPLSMGFLKQEYWSGLPFPPPGDLSHLGIEPVSPALAGRFFTTKPLGKPIYFLPGTKQNSKNANCGKNLKASQEQIGVLLSRFRKI